MSGPILVSCFLSFSVCVGGGGWMGEGGIPLIFGYLMVLLTILVLKLKQVRLALC